MGLEGETWAKREGERAPKDVGGVGEVRENPPTVPPMLRALLCWGQKGKTQGQGLSFHSGLHWHRGHHNPCVCERGRQERMEKGGEGSRGTGGREWKSEHT